MKKDKNKDFCIAMIRYAIKHRRKKKRGEKSLLFDKWDETYPTPEQTRKYINAFSGRTKSS